MCDLNFCRAGPSLSAFNYDSTYGKKALMMMYRGILEQVKYSKYSLSFSKGGWGLFNKCHINCICSKELFCGNQDGLPVLPSGCSEDQASLQGFITKAKAALVSVGIIRDALMCKLLCKLICLIPG